MDRATLIAAPREIETARLLLQAPRPEHAAAFVESLNLSLPGLAFIGWGQKARELDWGERFCADGLAMVEAGECLIFNALEREGGAYVGRIDLHSFDFEAPRCEVGYVGDVRLAGRGLMREAVQAVIDFGFGLGLARIHALSDLRNERAQRFALLLGMQREGVLRAFERDPQGELADMVMWSTVAPRRA